MERIENRAERRAARRKHRMEAQADRQAMREQRTEARLERRRHRAEARAERKHLRHPDEENTDNQNQPSADNGQGGGQGEGQGAGENPRSLPPDSTMNEGQGGGQGDTTEGSNVGEGEYPTGRGRQNYPNQEDAGYGDSEGSSEGDSEDSGDSNDEEYGFDGVMGAEDRYVELSDNDNIQRINVSPDMIDLANKYEWNKELVCRLIAKKADAQNNGATPTKGLQEEIAMRKDRMNEIKSNFDNYLNYDCSFSEACGCSMSSADGTPAFRKNNNHKRKHREHQVKRALGVAREKRDKIKSGSMASALAHKKAKMNYYGGDVTPVETELSPEFTTNRIVVPAESKSNYDGTNGLGYANDLDAPPTREVFLGFDGSTTRNIMVVGLAVLVGYIVYKQVKK
jgi:hypothetical protein